MNILFCTKNYIVCKQALYNSLVFYYKDDIVSECTGQSIMSCGDLSLCTALETCLDNLASLFDLDKDSLDTDVDAKIIKDYIVSIYEKAEKNEFTKY